jgi:hypothetical protein
MASNISRGTPVWYRKLKRAKFSLEQDVKAQSGSRGIVLLFL